jgi:hypothetical protein
MPCLKESLVSEEIQRHRDSRYKSRRLLGMFIKDLLCCLLTFKYIFDIRFHIVLYSYT